jgi:hypothetical protein
MCALTIDAVPVDPSPYTHDGVPFANLATQLVDAAAAALTQTTLGSVEWHGVWHDAPPEDCPEFLSLWIREFVPIAAGEFPAPAATLQRCDDVDYHPRFVLSLRRPCATIPDAHADVDIQAESDLAQALYVDLRALTCGVKTSWPPIVEAMYGDAAIMWGQIVPTGASTNLMGWDWDITVAVPECGAC